LRRLYALVMLYGALNAASYSLLLPLWEGFDEAYHYGYVQLLSKSLRFPVLGEAKLSREIWHSLELAPVSHYLQSYTHAPVNFGEYFAFSKQERVERRQRLDSIPRDEQNEPRLDKPNYEVNQSPAAYLFMASIDHFLSGWPITIRVLTLRLICSILAVVLIADATRRLAARLKLSHLLSAALLFCAFSSQMFYATLCHVCNDTFAVPAMGYLLLAALAATRTGASRDWLLFGLALSIALLIKAYFLFVIPLAIFTLGWVLWKRRVDFTAAEHFIAPLAMLAAPWYGRNFLLYNNLSATVQSTSGLGLGDVWKGALNVPWLKSIPYMAHASLWTGNNSFTTFSATTLNIELILLAAGIVLYFVHSRREAAEWIVVAAIVLFSCGLAVISIAFFLGTQGQAFAAVPWYMQVLLVPVLLIFFLGLSRAPKWGRFIAPTSIGLWAYILAATYIAKLIPLYGGLELPRAHAAALWNWYRQGDEQRDSILATICLGNVAALKALLAATLVLNVILGMILVIRTASDSAAPESEM
jgi:hypothetical protein